MAPGSVVVDLAAAQGGNCELSEPDAEVDVDGVTLLAPTNLPATVPAHASRLYAKNLTNFLKLLIVDDAVRLDLDDPIIADTLVTHGGEVVAPRVRERLGLGAAEPAPPAAAAEPIGPAAGQATDVPTTAGG